MGGVSGPGERTAPQEPVPGVALPVPISSRPAALPRASQSPELPGRAGHDGLDCTILHFTWEEDSRELARVPAVLSPSAACDIRVLYVNISTLILYCTDSILSM